MWYFSWKFKKITDLGNKLILNASAGVGSWNPGYVYIATNFGVAEAHGYFIGGDNWDTKLSTDINNWEEFYREREDMLFVTGEEDE